MKTGLVPDASTSPVGNLTADASEGELQNRTKTARSNWESFPFTIRNPEAPSLISLPLMKTSPNSGVLKSCYATTKYPAHFMRACPRLGETWTRKPESSSRSTPLPASLFVAAPDSIIGTSAIISSVRRQGLLLDHRSWPIVDNSDRIISVPRVRIPVHKTVLPSCEGQIKLWNVR
jgi:hypothetical protein